MTRGKESLHHWNMNGVTLGPTEELVSNILEKLSLNQEMVHCTLLKEKLRQLYHF